MTLGHKKLDVYRLAIGNVAWVYEKANGRTEFTALRGTNGCEPVSRSP